MIMRILLFILLLLPLSVLTAQTTEDTTEAPYSAPMERFERVFNPSAYDTELYLYKKSDTLRVNGRPLDQTTAAPPETLQGFRIQLLATNNFDEANTTRNELIAGFPDLWIYLVFEAPTYKIRVGDFVNRAEAKPLLDQFMAQGYRRSWIVPDRIIRNQPPKPPVPFMFDNTTVRE
jgi:hypothetical protein